MPVPNSFANVTTSIPLSQLDANFNTPITLGNTAIQLGNTVSTLNNMTLANVTVTSGNVTITNVTVTTANVTTANIATAVITTANVTTANITTGNVSGNLSFTSTGQRILGDFSNATVANRVAFQTSTTNSGTFLYVLPNGTSNSSGYTANSNSADPANASEAFLGVSSTAVVFNSNIRGTGTYLPMTFSTGGSERMRLDTSGNLGLGVTPSAWGSYNGALDLKGGGALGAFNSSTALFNNSFYNGSNSIYKATTGAAFYQMAGNVHQWFNAPSGTAGNAITFTQAMTLDASGNLGIGETSPVARLHVKTSANNATGTGRIVNTSNGSAAYSGFYIGNDASETDAVVLLNSSTNTGYGGARSLLIGTNSPAPNVFITSGTERARITSDGLLLINSTSPSGGILLSKSTTTFNSGGQTFPFPAGNVFLHQPSVRNENNWFGLSPLNCYDASTGSANLLLSAGNRNTGEPAGNYIGSEVTSTVTSVLTFGRLASAATTGGNATKVEFARFTSAGGFTCAGIYNTTVGATNRDVFVDNTGVVGYVASIREAKTNIQDLTDTSWLHQLNPVTFNYRKKDEEGSYSDETDGDIQYGLIAEDVEQVRPDLCFYDDVDGEQELRGIQYSKLVPVMLKEIQKLRAELNALKGNA